MYWMVLNGVVTWEGLLKKWAKIQCVLGTKKRYFWKFQHYNGKACFRTTRKFLPVGSLLCNDLAFLPFTCWVSGTVVVVVVYSIIYIKKKEKIPAKLQLQTLPNNTGHDVPTCSWNVSGTRCFSWNTGTRRSN
jgi:hypothetical protein